MVKNIYCICDDLNGFMSPFCAPTEAYAKRDFSAAVNNDKANAIAFSPNDFSLYYLGTFNDVSGLVEPAKVPEMICRGGDLVARD